MQLNIQMIFILLKKLQVNVPLNLMLLLLMIDAVIFNDTENFLPNIVFSNNIFSQVKIVISIDEGIFVNVQVGDTYLIGRNLENDRAEAYALRIVYELGDISSMNFISYLYKFIDDLLY